MTLNISEKILFILAVVLGWIATAFAWCDDNHSPIDEVLAKTLMILSVTITFLVAYGLVRSYIREYKMKDDNTQSRHPR